MKTISRRHHYIPVSYLNGFGDKSNQFFVYDKKADRIWKTNSRAAFFEKDRNMAINNANGEKDDWLERLYSEIDGRGAALVKEIISSKASEWALDSLQKKFEFGLFLTYLFWRVPAQDAQSADLLDSVGFETGYFDLLEKTSGKPVAQDIKKMILADESMRKAYRLVLPLIPFFIDSTYASISKWKFYYQDPGFNITGDNPIIQKEDKHYENILDEFVFPVSSNRLLVSSESIPAKDLPPEFTVDFNAAIIHKAERFVCCKDEGFLKVVLEYYDTQKRFGEEGEIVDRIFSYPNTK